MLQIMYFSYTAVKHYWGNFYN